MILLCPLIHPPNRCRSQWLHTNAFFPSILWINVRLVSSGNERHSKGEMRVCAFSCVCLSKSGVCVWEREMVCVCTLCCLCVCFVVWVGGMGGVWSVCLFVFVSGSRLLHSAPLAVMACLWDTDIKLSDWSLSAFEVSWAVHPDLSSRGGSVQYGCCLKISHLCVFARGGTKPPSFYYFGHVWSHSYSFSKCLFSLISHYR